MTAPVADSFPSAWPLCSYAPGNYTGLCVTCGERFDGDKRALECLECAVRSAKFLIERGAAVKAAAINLHDNLALWREYGGPALPAQVEQTMKALIALLRDSDSDPEGGDGTAPCIASQSGVRRDASPKNPSKSGS